MRRRKRYPWLLGVLVLAADRVTKLLAVRYLVGAGRVTLVPHVLGLSYAENTGMAFSLLSGQSWVLGVLSAAVIAGAVLMLRGRRPSRAAQTALMLMLGGAVGNMIDRFATGYVVDMIEVLLFRFAIFNVADAALSVGCVLLILLLLLGKDDLSHGNTDDTAV